MRGVVVNTALVFAFLAFLAPTLEAQESEDEPQRGDIAVVSKNERYCQNCGQLLTIVWPSKNEWWCFLIKGEHWTCAECWIGRPDTFWRRLGWLRQRWWRMCGRMLGILPSREKVRHPNIKNPDRRSDRHLILQVFPFIFIFLRLDDNVDCISCPTAEDPSQWREVPFN